MPVDQPFPRSGKRWPNWVRFDFGASPEFALSETALAKLRLASFCKSKPRSPGKLTKSNLELVWRPMVRAPQPQVCFRRSGCQHPLVNIVKSAIIFLLFVFLSSVSSAQTQIDLSSQSRNVDFSGARSVIPFPTGTALPPTCTPGAVFFKTNAQAGANIYACSSQDVWTLQGPASSSATWGNITGTLSNQTDLNTALSGKADAALSNLSNPSTARSNLGLGSAATQPSSAFPAVSISIGRRYYQWCYTRCTPGIGYSGRNYSSLWRQRISAASGRQRGFLRVWHEYIRCPGRRACQRRSKRYLRHPVSGEWIFVRELRRPIFPDSRQIQHIPLMYMPTTVPSSTVFRVGQQLHQHALLSPVYPVSALCRSEPTSFRLR